MNQHPLSSPPLFKPIIGPFPVPVAISVTGTVSDLFDIFSIDDFIYFSSHLIRQFSHIDQNGIRCRIEGFDAGQQCKR